MTTSKNELKNKLEDKLDYIFKDHSLLMRALTHKSYYYESMAKSQGHNERLEFIGDAVLDLSVGALLMKEYPELDEGPLSKIRASLVNEEALAEMALSLGMDKELRLGRGEVKNGGSHKPRLLASAYEAVVGALFWEAGYDKACEFVEKVFRKRLVHLDLKNQYARDYKTHLQERSQELFRAVPFYKVIRDEGPDHNKTFYVEVCLGNKVIGRGKGKSKKQAEQEAACNGLEDLE